MHSINVDLNIVDLILLIKFLQFEVKSDKFLDGNADRSIKKGRLAPDN